MDLPSDLTRYLNLENEAADASDLDDLDKQLPSLILLEDIKKYIRKYIFHFIYI